ncbi:MAG TPA: hypothetical protein VN843_09545, partial [Anaerolineales bacterium]|nr:hypothetical protein [Anaerolineales bacterium]
AIQLLKKSIEQKATIIAIGPFTNLNLLELQYPGILMGQSSSLWEVIFIRYEPVFLNGATKWIGIFKLT